VGDPIQDSARPSGQGDPEGDADQEGEQDADECQSQGIRQHLADEARDRNALDEIRSKVSLDRAANEMPDLQRDRVIEPHPCSNHRDQLGGGMLSEYDPCGVAGNEMDGERQQNGRQQHDE
jgi:hypothetical protein